MTKTWAISGADLHLDLHGTRVRAGFERALREAVQSGRLRPGSRLPSTRTLATDLGIARNTVAEAYAQLVAEGWFTARTGSGTWVSDQALAQRRRPRARTEAERSARYDLSPRSPDVSSFPRAAWQAAARRVLTSAPNDFLRYGDPRGLGALRGELADYLARARGVRADPDNIVICSGFVQGLSLICRVLRDRGVSTIAIEEDGHRLHRDVVTNAGLRARPILIDGDGIQVARFGSAGAAMCTPAHQFPHGIPLAASRRTAAIRWAVENNAVLLEDDYDGEFRFDRQAVGALQALAPDAVVYAGTASKTLAPGVRLGWLVVPPRLRDDVIDAKRLFDGPHGTLDQLTFAEFLRSGAHDRHVRSRRLAYRRRREYLVRALARHAPNVRVHGVAAGLHAVLELPAGANEDDVIARAAARGVAIGGMHEYRLSKRPVQSASIVVSFGTPPDHAFTTAIERLCGVLAELNG